MPYIYNDNPSATTEDIDNTVNDVLEDNTLLFINMSDMIPGHIVTMHDTAHISYCMTHKGPHLNIVQRVNEGGIKSRECMCTDIGVEAYKDSSTGEMLKEKYTFHFGDNAPPIIVDCDEDTITLDPDWVAPTGEGGVTSYNNLTDKPTGDHPGKIVLTWDGEPTDQDQIITSISGNDTPYYKVSALVPPIESITEVLVFRDNGMSQAVFSVGTNCCIIGGGIGDAIIVTKAGECVKSDGTSFTAPTTGIYFVKRTAYYASECQITCNVPDSVFYLNSSSGKRFAITVSDVGVIAATEVAE